MNTHRPITTFDKAIKLLGGVTGVALTFERTTQAVSSWKRQGKFPPSYYLQVKEELAQRGLEAADDLFAFKPVRRRQQRVDAA